MRRRLGATSSWSTNSAGTTDAGQIPGPNTNVIFSASNAVGNFNNGSTLQTSLTANFTIQGLTFAAPSTSGTHITATQVNLNGYSLALGTSGLTLAATSISAATILNGSIQLSSSQSWANNNATLSLVDSATVAPSAAGLTTLTFSGSGAGGLALDGALGDGSGQLALVFKQAGITQLNAANTFTGGVTISRGTVQLGNNGALNSTTPDAVTFGSGSGNPIGDLQIKGNAVAVSSLNLDGTVQAVVENANAGGGTLTVANSAASTYGGTLRDGFGGGGLALVAAGSSTFCLAGSDIYSGGTTVTSGTLQVGAGGNVGALGSGNVIDNSVLVFNRGDSYTLSNSVSGAGSLYQTSAGLLRLTGTNAYSGGSTVRTGILQFGNTAAMPSAGTVSVASGAVLAVNAGGTGEFNNGAFGAGSIGGLLAGVGGQGGTIAWNSGASLGIDASDAPSGLNYDGVIGNSTAGPLGLDELGSGTLTFLNANSYTGGTKLLGGTLRLGNGFVSGSIDDTSGVNIAAGAAINYDLASSDTASYAISGSGSLELTDGTLTLSGSNTYSGGTDVFHGELIVDASGSLPAGGNLSVGSPATLALLGGIQPATADATPLSVASPAPVPEPGSLASRGRRSGRRRRHGTQG